MRPVGPEAHDRSADNQAESRSETAVAFLTWPIFTFLLLAFPLLATQALSGEGDEDFEGALKQVARWMNFSTLQGSYSPGGFDTAPGFAYLAVVGAIVVGLAFSLPPGGTRDLPVASQRVVAAITIGVVLSSALLSVAIIWNMLAGTTTLAMLLLLASAWLVTLLTSLINLKRSTGDLLRQAEKEWQRYNQAAQAGGLYIRAMPSLRRERVATWTFWVLPPLLSLFLPLAGIIIWDFRGRDIQDEALGFLGLLPAAALLMQLGWYGAPAYPPHTVSDRVSTWLLRLMGMILLVIPVVVGGLAHSWAFFVLALLVLMALVLLLAVPAAAERFAFIRVIRLAATVRRLNRVHSWLVKMQERHEVERAESQRDELQEAERQSQCCKRDAQPLIRIEIFRRKSKSMRSSGVGS